MARLCPLGKRVFFARICCRRLQRALWYSSFVDGPGGVRPGDWGVSGLRYCKVANQMLEFNGRGGWGKEKSERASTEARSR